MRKWLALLLGSLTLAARAQDLTLENPKLDQEVYQQTVARLQARDKIPPADNGYPMLFLLFDRQLASTRALSDYGGRPRAEQLKMFRQNPKQLSQQIGHFESRLSIMRQANARKHIYQVYDWKSGWPAELTPRPLFLGLQTDGYYYEFKGQPQKAAERYLLGLELTSKLEKAGPPVTRLIASSLQDKMALSLARLIGEHSFPAAYYRNIAQKVADLPILPGDYGEGQDEGYVAMVNLFDSQLSGKIKPEKLVAFYDSMSLPVSPQDVQRLHDPHFLAQEKCLCQNVWLRLRPYALKLESQPTSEWQAIEREFQTHHSWLAKERAPLPAVNTFRDSLTHLSALRILAALQAYHAESKRYPGHLKGLVPQYLPQLPANYMSQDGQFIYALQGKTFRLESISERRGHRPRKMSYYPMNFSI